MQSEISNMINYQESFSSISRHEDSKHSQMKDQGIREVDSFGMFTNECYDFVPMSRNSNLGPVKGYRNSRNKPSEGPLIFNPASFLTSKEPQAALVSRVDYWFLLRQKN